MGTCQQARAWPQGEEEGSRSRRSQGCRRGEPIRTRVARQARMRPGGMARGASHLINVDLSVGMCVNGYILKPTTNGMKITTRRPKGCLVPRSSLTKDTFVSTCYTHARVHTHTQARTHAHMHTCAHTCIHTQAFLHLGHTRATHTHTCSPPAGARVLPTVLPGSARRPPAAVPSACPRRGPGRLPDVASIVGLARLALLLLSLRLLTRFLRLLLLLVLPADTAPKVP